MAFLKAIQTIFEVSEREYQLSSEQSDAIVAAREEIENGNYSKNSSVISEMKQWLEKK